MGADADYYDGLYALFGGYLTSYQIDPERFRGMVIELEVVAMVCSSIYYVLKNEGDCLPIDKLPEAEKRRIWGYVKDLDFPLHKKIERCQAILALETAAKSLK